MICSSNVFSINNLDPDPESEIIIIIIISDPLHCTSDQNDE
jgi:hypothetical protein